VLTSCVHHALSRAPVATKSFWSGLRRAVVLIACIAAASLRCTGSDRVTAPSEPLLEVRSASGVWMSSADQRAVLGRLARLVAIGIANAQVRDTVYAAMRASVFQEQKVHFRSFLNTSGRSLLTAMAAARGTSANDVLASLDSAVDLEFYMPVRQQRERWRGEPVIVATALRDHELPSAYDNQGNVVPILSPDIPPAALALALVPVETDFSAAPAMTPARAGIHASTTFGTCPPDACLTYAYVPGDWEGWLMGQPEFETHVFVRETDSSVAYH